MHTRLIYLLFMLLLTPSLLNAEQPTTASDSSKPSAHASTNAGTSTAASAITKKITHDPYQVIVAATEELSALVKSAQLYYEEEPERYFQAIAQWADPLIDFPSFTRSVMGDYGTRAYYQSLTDEQKAQFKTDYRDFVTTFKNGLISTYAKGLLAFHGQKIDVLPLTEEQQANAKANKPVDVKQTIQGKQKLYTVTYKMSPNKEGKWLLRNVQIDSVNVGQLYRQQFVASMQRHEQDFSKVIANWVIDAKGMDDEVAQPQE